jgi:hypothetical protein
MISDAGTIPARSAGGIGTQPSEYLHDYEIDESDGRTFIARELLFVTSNPTGWSSSLLYVDLAGNAHKLCQVKGSSQSWGIASRDGNYLASPAATTSSNVWA